MTYSEKLKDPRWQKKRLEIMERDGFACQSCGDNESTLNVHHCRYVTGKNPWEYDNLSLTTLCEPCHEMQHEMEDEWKDQIIEVFKICGYCCREIYSIRSDIFSLANKCGRGKLIEILRKELS